MHGLGSLAVALRASRTEAKDPTLYYEPRDREHPGQTYQGEGHRNPSWPRFGLADPIGATMSESTT